MYPGLPPIELQRLSDTRWACRYYSVHAVQKRFSVILKVLDDIIDEPNSDRSLDARIGVPELIFLGGREIFARIFTIVQGYYNNLWKTCPSRKQSGVPQIWLSVLFGGLNITQILISTYFPKHKIFRYQAIDDKQLYRCA